MYAARDKIIDALVEYSRSPEEDLASESYLARTVRADAKRLEIGERDSARMNTILFWA